MGTQEWESSGLCDGERKHVSYFSIFAIFFCDARNLTRPTPLGASPAAGLASSPTYVPFLSFPFLTIYSPYRL